MKLAFAVLIVATTVTARTASAQSPSAPATPPTSAAAPKAAEPPDYPGLGEVMTLQQLRHIKLWFAGHAGNWPLANYEIGELQEGFEDATKLVGGDTVEKQIGDPIKHLQKAIDGRDRAAFIVAFDKLSAGCNSCHHALGRPFIAIKRPTLLPYSDQSFTPH